jgi:hypothetical protein
MGKRYLMKNTTRKTRGAENVLCKSIFITAMKVILKDVTRENHEDYKKS